MTTIDPAWRPTDAPRQDGRVVVVTGASRGLGAETALAAAGLAATVVLAARSAARHSRIDVLVANAGVMGTPPRRTADGFELQQATNHPGHQALVGRLLDAALAAAARDATEALTGVRTGL